MIVCVEGDPREGEHGLREVDGREEGGRTSSLWRIAEERTAVVQRRWSFEGEGNEVSSLG